jgi:hypothetical protein
MQTAPRRLQRAKAAGPGTLRAKLNIRILSNGRSENTVGWVMILKEGNEIQSIDDLCPQDYR